MARYLQVGDTLTFIGTGVPFASMQSSMTAGAPTATVTGFMASQPWEAMLSNGVIVSADTVGWVLPAGVLWPVKQPRGGPNPGNVPGGGLPGGNT